MALENQYRTYRDIGFRISGAGTRDEALRTSAREATFKATEKTVSKHLKLALK